ncbi:MAG: AI-2E family transporter [Deltaproteobacteria bacterium]|nr:AI-2E family transporter [Deltaproteobacteria bacterium]
MDSEINWGKFVPTLYRVLVWGLIFGIVYLLRSFFLLIFLTFVFSYVQANGVMRLESRIKNRTARVVLAALVLLTLLLSVGAFLVPHVKEQAQIFADRYPGYLQNLDGEILNLADNYPAVREFLQLHFPEHLERNGAPRVAGEPRRSLASELIQLSLGFGDGEGQDGVREVIGAFRNIGAYLFTLGSAFLLSLLFSFLIVLDLPALTKSVKSLATTKLGFVYEEVAPSVRDFGTVLGRALEAQLFIAILNTVLTALGLMLLGLNEKIAFLSLIVFLCSFIPVAGVFISSLPICLVALQESGFGLMFLSVIMITVIHMIEAYILNPRIYGHHLHLNPVVVLIILTIGGKMFNVWGLVLGVPICVYIFGHAIQYKLGERSAKGAAAA